MNSESPIIGVELGTLEQSCFVVMPFNPMFQSEYERVIRPAIEAAGLRCVRGDEIYSKPRIMDDIWKSIRAARVVVAELTGKNPNVFYEVGLAQAIGKPVIILTRNEDDVPFDLKALRYLYYDVQNAFWGHDLKTQLTTMLKRVIDEDGLSAYLEGITAIDALKFPESQRVAPKRQESEKPPPPNLAGLWRAAYDLPHRGVSTIEKTLNLSQQKASLSGIEITTYFRGKTPTIVQQSLTGNVSNKTVTLNGVNYTFLQRGGETSYLLDNYVLELTDDLSKMTGHNVDNHGRTSGIVYTRSDHAGGCNG